MENKIVKIKSSLKGILGQVIKYLVFALADLIALLISKGILSKLYSKNGYKSFSDFISKILDIIDKPAPVLIMFGLNLLILFLLILEIIFLFKILALFLEINNNITVNFGNNRITSRNYTFPLTINNDDNILNKIVEVNIEQNVFDLIFNTGDMYIEYLSTDKDDAKTRSLSIKHLMKPMVEKEKLI
ncbi:MAG TPA: hypothetical protein VIK72_18330 [Clostridiaceae bacterium]